jgi:hypothetical protein
VTEAMLYDHERIRGSVTRMVVYLRDQEYMEEIVNLVGGASDPLSKKRLKKELRN